jgi:hypothetical protein
MTGRKSWIICWGIEKFELKKGAAESCTPNPNY